MASPEIETFKTLGQWRVYLNGKHAGTFNTADAARDCAANLRAGYVEATETETKAGGVSDESLRSVFGKMEADEFTEIRESYYSAADALGTLWRALARAERQHPELSAEYSTIEAAQGMFNTSKLGAIL